MDTTQPWNTVSATPTPTGDSNGNKAATTGASDATGTKTGADATSTGDAKDVASLYTVKMELVGFAALVVAVGVLL